MEYGAVEVILGALGRYLGERDVVGWALAALAALTIEESGRKVVGEMGMEAVLGGIEKFGDDVWVFKQGLVAISNLVFGNIGLKKQVGNAGLVETICGCVERFGKNDALVAQRGILALRNLCFECEENVSRILQWKGLVQVLEVAKHWVRVRNVRIHTTLLLANLVGLADRPLTQTAVISFTSFLRLVGQLLWMEEKDLNSKVVVPRSSPLDPKMLHEQGMIAESFFFSLSSLTSEWAQDIFEHFPDTATLILSAVEKNEAADVQILDNLCACFYNIVRVEGSLKIQKGLASIVTKLLNVIESSPLSEKLILVIFKTLAFISQDRDECIKVFLEEDGIALICNMLEINRCHLQIQATGFRLLRIMMQARRKHRDIGTKRIPLDCREVGQASVWAINAFPGHEELVTDALKNLEVIERSHCEEVDAERAIEILLSRRRPTNDDPDQVIELGLSVLRKLKSKQCLSMTPPDYSVLGKSFDFSFPNPEAWCRGDGEMSMYALNNGLAGIARRCRLPYGRQNIPKKERHVRFNGKPEIRLF